MSNAPEYASDSTTLVEILAGYEDRGFTTQMAAREGRALECLSCRTTSPSSAFELSALRRTEGASDPADMAVVAALVCPSCQARGTVVLAFGPEATAEDSEVLKDLDDRRDSSGADATSYGGEQRD